MNENKTQKNEDDSQEDNEKLQDLTERHRRYESLRREQLGSALNLTFGLAVAGVGFCASLVVNKDSKFSYPGTCFFLIATISFMVSVGIGIFANLTRLKDFRLSVKMLKLKKERIKEKDQRKIDELTFAVREYKNMTDNLGDQTWCLFRVQQFAFAIAVIVLSIALWLLYRDQLFPPAGSLAQ